MCWCPERSFEMASTKSTLTITKICPAIGAVVSGIDLSQPLSKDVVAEVEKALAENLVLFFEGQHNLKPESHRAFAQNFGKLHTHPYFPNLKDEGVPDPRASLGGMSAGRTPNWPSDPGVPELIVFDTNIKNPPDSNNWHTDVTFIKNPPMGCVLRAVQIPSCGGDTTWASTIAAYNSLSKPFQAFLDGLTATHDFAKAFPVERWGEEFKEIGRKAVADHPPLSHPVVRVHPVTGQKGLFAGGFTIRINELSKEESDTVLRYLTQHVAKPEHTVRWHWKAGDVAFWDNRLTQHYALADYLPERRIMNRATIIGDVPYGPKQAKP